MINMLKNPHRYAVLWFVFLFLIAFVADIFLWRAHPTAAILGTAFANLLDPMVLLISLVIGAAVGFDWKGMLASVLAAIGLELLTVASGTRTALGGPNNFELLSFIGKFVAVCAIVAIIGLIRSRLAKSG
jgi:hypothetical protein